MLFCMGSMTRLGAIEEGLGGRPDLLLAKSLLDGIASLTLASAAGIGVLFSAAPLLLYQGGLTVAAALAGNIIPESVVMGMSSVGGVLLLGLGLRILDVRRVRVLDMLPSILFAIPLAWLIDAA